MPRGTRIVHFDCGAGLTFGRRLTAGRVRARQAVACLHETRHGLNGPLFGSRFAHDCGINACLVRRLALVGRLGIGRMYLAYCCNSGWLHGAEKNVAFIKPQGMTALSKNMRMAQFRLLVIPGFCKRSWGATIRCSEQPLQWRQDPSQSQFRADRRRLRLYQCFEIGPNLVVRQVNWP
jgi:hypothetical protein